MNDNYWPNVFNTFRDLYQMITGNTFQHQISQNYLNPFHAQITDTGGIGIEIYMNLPIRIYTPLGTIGTCNISKHIDSAKRHNIARILKNDYVLKNIAPAPKTFPGPKGHIYAIIQSPGCANTLPMFTLKPPSNYIDYTTAKNEFLEALKMYSMK